MYLTENKLIAILTSQNNFSIFNGFERIFYFYQKSSPVVVSTRCFGLYLKNPFFFPKVTGNPFIIGTITNSQLHIWKNKQEKV